MKEWLEEQPVGFTEYDDIITRRMIERIEVVDAETIKVKIRDMEVVIEQKLVKKTNAGLLHSGLAFF